MKVPGATRKAVVNYWAQWYIQDTHCSLCGNSGVIDTRGIKTPAGYPCGRVNLCICPNGQALRSQGYVPKN